jgi:hypothetical protein
MVRMGLAKAKSVSMVARASWKSNWEFYSDVEVKPMYDRVMRHLIDSHPYGEFLAIEVIFGTTIARQLAKQGQVCEPAHSRLEALQAKSSAPAQKRKVAELSSGSEDDRPARRRTMEDLDSDME